MNKEQQDKLWNDLSEESKESHRQFYEFYKGCNIESYHCHVCRQMEKTFGLHNLNPKPLTYENIARDLFKDEFYFIKETGEIGYQDLEGVEALMDEPHIASSEKQLSKLLAINKLLNVAKYLNGNWKPNWLDASEEKWQFQLSAEEGLEIRVYVAINSGIVYFRTEELAQQALKILGEETIYLALSTDY